MFEVLKAEHDAASMAKGLEAFMAFDSGKLCGTIVYSLEKDKLVIADLKIEMTVEGLDVRDVLLRAAAASAQESGVIIVKTGNQELFPAFEKLGFTYKNERLMTAPIERLLKKQCRHDE